MDLTREINHIQIINEPLGKSAYIRILNPLVGNVFQVDDIVRISWKNRYINKKRFKNVRIELYKDDVFDRVISESTDIDSDYVWTVPAIGGSVAYKIKVIAHEDIVGFSGYFEIGGVPTEIDGWILTNYYYGNVINYINKGWILSSEIYQINTKPEMKDFGWILSSEIYQINTKPDTFPNGWVLTTDGV